MDKQAVLERITKTGVIPVIRAQSADEAALAIAAIQKGGVSVLETFPWGQRTCSCSQSIVHCSIR